MRILHVGATGTIGTAVAAALAERRHQVVRVGASDGELQVDLSEPESIEALYAAARASGGLDAVVCTAGIARFGRLGELSDEDFRTSLANKLMGQVNLIRRGLEVVRVGGSFTLTSGTLSDKPEAGTSAVAMAGAAVEAFARAAAIDLAGRFRVNVVSPGAVADSRVARGLDPMPGIWAKDLAAYYVDLVEGTQTGAVVTAEGPMR
jgi:NAD(P)-dependent dehydrogenase (short-subunit alcohol dehydrogenase family)